MKVFLKIAWRNILRSHNRSLITILAVAIGFASLIFIRAFVNGADHQMVENYTALISGHIQIHEDGFQANMGLDKSISSSANIITALKNDPRVRAYSERIKEFALISSAERSSGVLLMGVDSAAEKGVTELSKRVRTGSFLSDNEHIVIGKMLASSLNVGLEDKVVIMGQAADGSLANEAYRVGGIMDTGTEELDKGLAIISLNAARELFVMGEKISEVAVRINDIKNVDAIAGNLKKSLASLPLEILTWKDITPVLIQWIEFDIAFTNIILLVVLLVVAAGILNTLLMATLERVKEFGIMLALGTKRIQIIFMVILESLILGSIGTIAGYIIGISLSLYFGVKGINLAPFSKALTDYYIGSIIYTRITPGYLIVYGSTVLITCIVVSVYPAWRAASLMPAEAIRT
ncbi:MAG: ABC transporter permease [Candidatus Omnitrophota bacterium]|nr:ABC transporter permease [Candidatus Omnitrophota bacterium]